MEGGDRMVASRIDLRILNRCGVRGLGQRMSVEFDPTTGNGSPSAVFHLAVPTAERHWWVLYTMARREKELMRQLTARGVSHYGALYEKKTRSPKGRVRCTLTPLFPSYVFLFGSDDDRRTALTTNCVARTEAVPLAVPLTEELLQIDRLLRGGLPITPEARLEPGTTVVVKSGPFKGVMGTLIRREKENRLVVAVNFLQRGASIEISDFEVEAVY
jgi:transcriptional antiterminator RfaH